MPLVPPGRQAPRVASIAADDPQTPRDVENGLGLTHRRVPQEQRRIIRVRRDCAAWHAQERQESKRGRRLVENIDSDFHKLVGSS